MIPLLALSLACSQPSLLATIPGATRVTELANGELLVGTASGELWLVTSFGETKQLADLGEGPVAELVSDPLGRFWARAGDGAVYTGGIWSSLTKVAAEAALLVRGCEATVWIPTQTLQRGVTARALFATCEAYVDGTADGRVQGRSVTSERITRVQAVDDGVLWVDSAGRAGCMDCAASPPNDGVVDAISLHLAPFIAGEVVWIDREGGLWVAPS